MFPDVQSKAMKQIVKIELFSHYLLTIHFMTLDQTAERFQKMDLIKPSCIQQGQKPHKLYHIPYFKRQQSITFGHSKGSMNPPLHAQFLGEKKFHHTTPQYFVEEEEKKKRAQRMIQIRKIFVLMSQSQMKTKRHPSLLFTNDDDDD